MINPELIGGMLFLPSMSDNEAIETVGAERFSNYSGLVLMESDVETIFFFRQIHVLELSSDCSIALRGLKTLPCQERICFIVLP